MPAKGTSHLTQLSPTSSAALVVASNANRISLTIYNNSSITVYLGNASSVTTSNGLPLTPNMSFIDSNSTAAWYAITGSGTGDLRSDEVYPVSNPGLTKGANHLTVVAPTTSAIQLLAVNNNRLQAIIINNGTQIVYLGVDNTVTVNNGIPLLQSAVLVDDSTTSAWWAIVGTGTGDTRINEVY